VYIGYVDRHPQTKALIVRVDGGYTDGKKLVDDVKTRFQLRPIIRGGQAAEEIEFEFISQGQSHLVELLGRDYQNGFAAKRTHL